MSDRRVDPSARDNEAIRIAEENNDIDMIKELLKDKRVVNKLTLYLKKKYKEYFS